MSKEMKTLNGYEIVDASARDRLAVLEQNGGSGGTTDLTGYATEEYVDNEIAKLETSFWLDFHNATTASQSGTAEMIAFAKYVIDKVLTEQTNNKVCLYVRDTDSLIYVPTLYDMSRSGNWYTINIVQSGFNLQLTANKEPVTWDILQLKYNIETEECTYKVGASSQFTFASVDEVQTMINTAIGDIENGSY